MGTSFWDTATSFTATAWRSCTDFLFQNYNLFLNQLSYLALSYKALNKKLSSLSPYSCPKKQTTPNPWIESNPAQKPPKDSRHPLNTNSESTDSKVIAPEFEGLFFTSSLKVPASVIYWVCFLHIHCSSLSPGFDLYYSLFLGYVSL